MTSTSASPSGFRALSPEETEAVTGGRIARSVIILFSDGKISFPGGGFGDTSAVGNPLKSLDDLYTPEGQAGLAALAAWIQAGAPWPPVIDLSPGIQPSPTAPPIMSAPGTSAGTAAPPAPSGSWTWGGGWDANIHLQ